MGNDHITLYELQTFVKDTLEATLTRSYWVEAELASVSAKGGHCYMELVEKDERGNTPIAKARAVAWRSNWYQLSPKFTAATGQTLHQGMKVLLKVRVSFHQSFGLAWVVEDIDPNFTLGDMMRRRQEIIKKLTDEGVIDMNKELELPLFCQRLAIIGGENTAGYGDFCNQLENNGYGLKFSTTLFPATMQGEQVEQSIINALDAIARRIDDFDCVVIIRGGGAVSDLSGFDSLALAENVAQFPLPIITGIGHERDDTVIDLIAHTRVKTPTAAAAFFIERLAGILGFIENAQQTIVRRVSEKLEKEQLRLNRLSSAIPHLFSLVKTKEENKLNNMMQHLCTLIQERLQNERHRIAMREVRLRPMVMQRMEKEKNRLQLLQQRTQALDPALLLRRGYSITLKDGHAVMDASQLHSGDEIVTRLSDGSVTSIVK